MNSARIRVLLLALGDVLLLGGVWLVCAAVYLHGWGGDYRWDDYFTLCPFLLIFVGCNSLIKLYHGNMFYPGMPLSSVEELRRMVFSITFCYLLLLAYLVFARRVEEFSRMVLIGSWLLSCVAISPWRNFFRFLLRKLGIGQIEVLIAGGGQTGRIMRRNFERRSYYGIKVIGYFDDNPATEEADPGWKRLGTLDDVVAVGQSRKIDCIVCCLPVMVVQRRLKEYVAAFPHLTIVPDNSVFPIAWSYPVDFHGISGIEFRNQLLLPGPRLTKKVVELVCTICGLILATPLFIVLAILVKLSSTGPIIYRAHRLGQYGRPIQVWKFRTMYVDADKELERLLAENPERQKEWTAKFKLTDDPRVTPLGRFLRRTSLDELPQLFNVLRGEMAMIGPRPIVEEEKEYYGEKYELFASVKPGITGLWQISGRSETDYEQRVTFDSYYIMNWTVWMDLYILEYTVWEALIGRGAR